MGKESAQSFTNVSPFDTDMPKDETQNDAVPAAGSETDQHAPHEELKKNVIAQIEPIIATTSSSTKVQLSGGGNAIFSTE